jgi:hypothetical protein
VVFSKQGERYKKKKAIEIQHAVMIANFESDLPARLGIAFIMASIGEGDYQVVKKRALCCSRSAYFFCSSKSFEKFGLPPEKKNWRKTLGRTP